MRAALEPAEGACQAAAAIAATSGMIWPLRRSHALAAIDQAVLAADPIAGNFQSAFDAVDRMRQVDRTAELKWDKIADDACPITRLTWRQYRRAAALLPFDGKSVV